MKSYVVVFLLLCCFGYGYVEKKQRVKNQELMEQFENYRQIVNNYQDQERIVWKYAANLPDSFLMEFYPDVENLDTLRARLVVDYEHYGEDGI